MAVRPRLDPKRDLVASKTFTYAGKEYSAGDAFPKEGLSPHNLRTLYGARHLNHAEAAPVATARVTYRQVNASNYEVSAPWLDAPTKVRGKLKAEALAADLEREGPPLGWIDGGTEVTVEGGEGGWYAIDAPWLEEAEKVQGREAAEARQLELHTEGEPATHRGVTLTEGDNGYWTIEAEWLDEPEKAHGESAARERAAELRDAGPPAELEEVAHPEVLVSVDGETFTVNAPWLEEPETFDDEPAAAARQAELREAGPPEGWEPPVGEAEPNADESASAQAGADRAGEDATTGGDVRPVETAGATDDESTSGDANAANN